MPYLIYPEFQTIAECERRITLDKWLVQFVKSWPDPDETRIAIAEDRIAELERRVVELQFTA